MGRAALPGSVRDPEAELGLGSRHPRRSQRATVLMKVTMLGTGIPAPDLMRRGASQVIEVGDDLVMVDCGRGALDRFVEAGYVEPGGRVLRRPIHSLALTHLHSDHVTGIPDLLWA